MLSIKVQNTINYNERFEIKPTEFVLGVQLRKV